MDNSSSAPMPPARLRPPQSGDRVVLRHSRSRLKISEALRRARLPPSTSHPVLEWQGEIVWMHGVAIESSLTRDFALTIQFTPLAEPIPV